MEKACLSSFSDWHFFGEPLKTPGCFVGPDFLIQLPLKTRVNRVPCSYSLYILAQHTSMYVCSATWSGLTSAT